MSKRRKRLASVAITIAVLWAAIVYWCDLFIALPMCSFTLKCVSVSGAISTSEDYACNFHLCPWSYYRVESDNYPWRVELEWRTEPKSANTQYTIWDSDNGFGRSAVNWTSDTTPVLIDQEE